MLAGKLKGERRSKRRGQSVEFADHRQYVEGDDLRHIDWNIFGRLDRLFIKMFLEEEDLSLHIVMDASASLDAGEPNKFLLTQRLAIALGYIGLANLHRVTLTVIGGTSPAQRAADAPVATAEAPASTLHQLRDLRGRRRLQDMSRFLIGIEPGGATPFTESCKRIAMTRRGKGIMVIISDFLIKEGYESGLRMLVGHGYELFVLPVLSPQEKKPTIGGDLRLKDVEDADLADLTVTSALLKKYEQTVRAYFTRLRDFCAARSISLMLDSDGLPVSSDKPIDTILLDYLRRRGLLR